MRHEMIGKASPLLAAVFFLVLVHIGLPLATSSGKDRKFEDPFPWTFGGHREIDQLHLRYWSVDSETLRDIQELVRKKRRTEISKLWFRKRPPQFRLDVYVESTSIKCKHVKGKQPDRISYDGKVYVLKKRVLQKGVKRTRYGLKRGSSREGESLWAYGELKSVESEAACLKQALMLLTVMPYVSEADEKRAVLASMYRMRRALAGTWKYKDAIAGLKKRYEKVGRQTAKWECKGYDYAGHQYIRLPQRGFGFVDLEWGMGLEAYLTDGRRPWEKVLTPFEERVCIYKVLNVSTEISSPEVFKKWED